MATNAFRWEDVWKAVATWANGTFSFSAGDQIDSCEPAKEDCLKYASLQQALAETGQNYNIVPTWIPEGYELTNITIGESPKQKLYNAFYSKGDTPLSIFVHAHLVSDPQRIEIGESPIEVYNSDGVEYYIFANINQFQIIWHIDSYECCISCELTIDEVKMMIDSIGKG